MDVIGVPDSFKYTKPPNMGTVSVLNSDINIDRSLVFMTLDNEIHPY